MFRKELIIALGAFSLCLTCWLIQLDFKSHLYFTKKSHLRSETINEFHEDKLLNECVNYDSNLRKLAALPTASKLPSHSAALRSMNSPPLKITEGKSSTLLVSPSLNPFKSNLPSFTPSQAPASSSPTFRPVLPFTAPRSNPMLPSTPNSTPPSTRNQNIFPTPTPTSLSPSLSIFYTLNPTWNLTPRPSASPTLTSTPNLISVPTPIPSSAPTTLIAINSLAPYQLIKTQDPTILSPISLTPSINQPTRTRTPKPIPTQITILVPTLTSIPSPSSGPTPILTRNPISAPITSSSLAPTTSSMPSQSVETQIPIISLKPSINPSIRKRSRKPTRFPTQTPTFTPTLSPTKRKRKTASPTIKPTNSAQFKKRIPFDGWKKYSNTIVFPEIIDMRKGGMLNITAGETEHYWGNNMKGLVYGYGIQNKPITFPGPTILTQSDVAIRINWMNDLPTPHILADNVALELLGPSTNCYPVCGTPMVPHVHGIETTAESDGLPNYSVPKGKVYTANYPNSQLSATLYYHDHAWGLTRLNVWAGLVGAYIIEDMNDKRINIQPRFDKVLILQDKLINKYGEVIYPMSDICPLKTKWIPGFFGNVNTVNGIIMPFMKISNNIYRLRFINAANRRDYYLNLPFFRNCKVIGTGSGFVRKPLWMKKPILVMFPSERIDILCDFSPFITNEKFDIIDVGPNGDEPMPVMQLRVISSSPVPPMSFVVPSILNNIKNFQLESKKALKSTPEKHITLVDKMGSDPCPDMPAMYLSLDGSQINFESGDGISCRIGYFEKWVFFNPTGEAHPFHWHLAHAQCGVTEASVDTNSFKDVVVIPAKPENEPALICYVSCSPTKFLLKGGDSIDFGFPTDLPVVAHCHFLEHEENMMMSWFTLLPYT